MNILMLNYEYPPVGGGAAQANQHLLEQFSKFDNLQIDVLTSAETSQFRIETVAPHIRLYRVGVHKKSLHYWRKTEIIEWLFKAKRHYKELVSSNHYDLIHAFFAFPSAYLCYKAARKIPYIVSLRGSDVPGFNVRLKLDYKLLCGLFRRIWKNADEIIANSEGLAELAKRFEPSLHYDVIPNGVDADYFIPAKQRHINGRVKLLTVCRLIARKQLHILIQTVGILTQQNIDVELNIVGDGNLRETLKSLAAQQGLSERIHFYGRIPYNQLPTIYQNNHIFLMSSAHEGMSNAMLEAMASGLPIITTSCEGTAELMDKNGIVLPSPDACAFAKAVQYVIENQIEYEAMANISRQKSLQFSWKNTAEAYIAVYDRLTEANQGRF